MKRKEDFNTKSCNGIMTIIKMQINNQDIPLNPIMSTVLTNMITGFIEALKGIPEEKNKISIEISF